LTAPANPQRQWLALGWIGAYGKAGAEGTRNKHAIDGEQLREVLFRRLRASLQKPCVSARIGREQRAEELERDRVTSPHVHESESEVPPATAFHCLIDPDHSERFQQARVFQRAGIDRLETELTNELHHSRFPAGIVGDDQHDGLDRIVGRLLTDALDKALDDESVRKHLLDLGCDIPAKSRRGPQPLAALVTSEIARWTPIIKAASIKAE